MTVNPDRNDTAPAQAQRILTLAPGLVRLIETFAESRYPREACGLLIGQVVRQRTRVEHVTEARNLNEARAHDRYLLNPDDFLGAEQRAQRTGLDVVGIWHSHPDHPSVPSQTDLEAAWPGYSYVIVSIEKGRAAELRSWKLHEGTFTEERIER